MTELSDAMRRLIEPWTLTVTVDGETREQQFPALVDMLTERITPNSAFGGGGGMASTRNVLDVNSLDMLMHMQDVTGAWLEEWGVIRGGDLKLDLRGYWDRLDTLHRTGVLDDITHDRLAAYPDTWAVKIWDLIDPPLTRPLRGSECPNCGRAKFINDRDDHVDNLIIRWRTGQEVTAECQWRECGAVWVGRDGLLELGRKLGTEFDFEALAEIGAQ